jgi:hypothetical protein
MAAEAARHGVASRAAKPRKVKDYSEQDLRRTAWWSWQDSNQPTSNYAGLGRGAASVRETQHLMLTPPRDRRVEEAGKVTGNSRYSERARKPELLQASDYQAVFWA